MSNSVFHGTEYDRRKHSKQLRSQQIRIRDFLLRQTAHGVWLTVPEIATALGISNHESIVRQIRYLRKPEHGEYRVERRKRRGLGLSVSEFQVREPIEVLQLEMEVG